MDFFAYICNTFERYDCKGAFVGSQIKDMKQSIIQLLVIAVIVTIICVFFPKAKDFCVLLIIWGIAPIVIIAQQIEDYKYEQKKRKLKKS